jgi:hypothetical protein
MSNRRSRTANPSATDRSATDRFTTGPATDPSGNPPHHPPGWVLSPCAGDVRLAARRSGPRARSGGRTPPFSEAARRLAVRPRSRPGRRSARSLRRVCRGRSPRVRRGRVAPPRSPVPAPVQRPAHLCVVFGGPQHRFRIVEDQAPAVGGDVDLAGQQCDPDGVREPLVPQHHRRVLLVEHRRESDERGLRSPRTLARRYRRYSVAVSSRNRPKPVRWPRHADPVSVREPGAARRCTCTERQPWWRGDHHPRARPEVPRGRRPGSRAAPEWRAASTPAATSVTATPDCVTHGDHNPRRHPGDRGPVAGLRPGRDHRGGTRRDARTSESDDR